jgi:hypothetical protein
MDTLIFTKVLLLSQRCTKNNIQKGEIMRADSIGYWKNKKEKLLKKYNNLTDKDLHFDLGRENEMIEMLCYKLGITNQELLTIIVTI